MFSPVLLLLSVFLSRGQSDSFLAENIVAVDTDANIAGADDVDALDAVAVDPCKAIADDVVAVVAVIAVDYVDADAEANAVDADADAVDGCC